MQAILFGLCLLAVVPGFSQSVDDLIKEEDVKRTISILASDEMLGRKPFTEGIGKAASFLVTEFRNAGLKPMSGDTGFLQSFEMQISETYKSSVVINSQNISEENIIVFASAENFSWQNDKDSVETEFIRPGERLVQELLQAIQGNKSKLIIIDTSYRKTFARFRSFKMPRFSNSGNLVLVMASTAAEKYSVQVTSKITKSTHQNIVGILPGRSFKDEFVIFSAHYDHLGIGKPVDGDSIYNGANDDASGVAAVIALAKYFSTINNNERTLVFVAFTHEESGGYGSKYFSEKLDPLHVKAMFNVEMIGTASKWGVNSAYITGFEMTDFGILLQENLSGSGFSFYADPYPEQELFYRSDNETLARKGVPAHTISTSKMDSEPYYHTVNDEVETLDIKNMSEIIKAIALSSKGIVSGKQTPTRVKTEELR